MHPFIPLEPMIRNGIREGALNQEFIADGSFPVTVFMLHRIISLILGVVIIFTAAVFAPRATSGPAASPEDRAREDLSRCEYPNMATIHGKGMFRVAPPLELKKLEDIFRHKVFCMHIARGKIAREMIAMLST